MNNKLKSAIETYQCPGCSFGSDISCFEKDKHDLENKGCGKHCAGTLILPGPGRVFLGLPHGFDRLGRISGSNYGEDPKIVIFEKFSEYTNAFGQNQYDKWNIPLWKHLNKSGHTIVRWIAPRRNIGNIHIFLENCLDKIDCFEVDQEMIDGMD